MDFSNALQVGVLFVVVLGIVIFVHELGHFLVAKWRGVTVLKFSLGMGPEIGGFTRGGTRYCLAWVPVGGFVQMAGDHLNDDGSMPEGGPEQFLTHPWFGRILIALAGPAANLVGAWVVMVALCMLGVQQPDYPPLLGTLPDTSAAHAAGLREGDRVLALAGHAVRTWHDIEEAADGRDRARPLVFDLDRGGRRLALAVPGADGARVLGGLEPLPRPPLVGSVMTGMPAYRAGLQEGDHVRAVDGAPVTRFDQIGAALRGRADRPVRITITRGGRTFDVAVTPMRPTGDAASSLAVIGIEAPRGLTWTERFGPLAAVGAGFRLTGGVIASVYQGLWLTLSQPVYYRQYVGGPIFIAQMARDSARRGLDNFLYFLAWIHVAIMSFNLLPVPLLDGGHIALALLEALRRRAISGRTYLNFQKVGLVLVGSLFVIIFSTDILRPLQRQQALGKAPRETTTVEPARR